MLETHIKDDEDYNSSEELVESKKTELKKLETKLDNLIEMRADGEITKEIFMSKSEPINIKKVQLQLEINELESSVPQKIERDYDAILSLLKNELETYVDFNNNFCYYIGTIILGMRKSYGNNKLRNQNRFTVIKLKRNVG